jgi:WhiB family redox-sensing transcriptional regulator
MFSASERRAKRTDHESSHRDRPSPPIDELVDALACTTSPQWNAARCRHTTSPAIHLFFSDDVADINQAKSICADCPVATPCLQGALDRHEPCGVWGGYLFADGQILARKRPRGRPPKHQPAQDIIQLTAQVRP